MTWSGPLRFLSALLEFYGRDRPPSIVSPDGNPHAVKFVQPNILNRPGFSVGENDGFSDEFGLHFPECVEDGRRAELNNRHGVSPQSQSGELFSRRGAFERGASRDRGGANECRRGSFGIFNPPMRRSRAVLTSVCGLQF